MATASSTLALTGALLVFSQLLNIATVSASCASCPIDHPQQKFCNSDFAFKARTISWQYVNVEGVPVLYSHQAYDVQYKMKLENVFKGDDEISKTGKTIFVYSPKNVCNIDTLEIGIRYLISGSMKGDKMMMSTCGIVEKWSDLTPSQRRGVRGAYQSQCSTCRVYGSTILRYFGGNEIIDEMSSGLWSKQECFFNPLASLTYGSDDCETKHSYCMRQKDGACAWEGGKAYDECFRQREYNWQLMQFAEMGLAAWTCPEQCKNLTPRKLKYKCKKATRKMAPCNSGDTVREFGPSSGGREEAMRTVDPSSLVAMRTMDPSSLSEGRTMDPSSLSEGRTMDPSSLSEGRTMDPSSLLVTRTVNPNVIAENPPTESPEILAQINALFDQQD